MMHIQKTIKRMGRWFGVVLPVGIVLGVLLFGVSVLLQQTVAQRRVTTFSTKAVTLPEVPFFAVAGARLAPVMPQAVMARTLLLIRVAVWTSPVMTVFAFNLIGKLQT